MIKCNMLYTWDYTWNHRLPTRLLTHRLDY